MRVNLIARHNGLGLSRDIEIMRRTLARLGCEVHVTALGEADERRRWRLGRPRQAKLNQLRQWLARRWRSPRFDLNIMFEHVWPSHLATARWNVALPNPEWFDDKDRRHLSAIDQVWAKTRQGEQLFQALGRRTCWIGFDGLQQAAPPPARDADQLFFHLAGGSRTKGTHRLLALWARHPEWPTLTVVGRLAEPRPASAANIRLIQDYLDEASLLELQRAHRFHLCPSEAEGYGHYIVEAMAQGALPITVDAPPMNELVTAERGLLVACRPGDPMGLVTTQLFDEHAMEQAIEQALQINEEAFAQRSQQALRWVHDNRQGFAGRVQHALQQLPAPG